MGILPRSARAAACAAILALGAVAHAGQQAGQQPPPTPPSGGQGAAQGQDPQQRPPVFRAGVNAVRVDVIVTDKDGNSVSDLTAADFEVQEDGKPQQIDLFKLVNSDGNVGPGAEPPRPIRSEYDQESEAARDDVRLFVIFLDDYHVRRGNAMRIRDSLIQFVKTQLGPLDMVAVMNPLMSVQQLTFTRDLEGVVSSLRTFEGRKYDYRPRNSFEEQYANYPAQAVETVRNEVTMTALRGLAVRLGSLREGRKAVILVSEGFSSLLPPQMRDPNAQLPGMFNPAAGNPNAGSSTAEDRARFRSDAQLYGDLRVVFDTANRHNTAIYAIDPRGLATNEFDINENVGGRLDQDYLKATQDTLAALAINTDGRAIINRNDLEKGLRQVVRDTSAYYLIGYNSPSPADGKFHELKVRIKRPGVQVRSRKGYWAPTAEEAAKASAPPKPAPPPAVEKALANVETRQRDAYISTWLGTGRGSDSRTRVTFVWEPIPPIPGEKRQDAARVQVLASSRGGEEYYRGLVPPEEPAPPADAPAAPGAAGAAHGIEGVLRSSARPHAIPRDRAERQGPGPRFVPAGDHGPGFRRHRGPVVDAGRAARPHAPGVPGALAGPRPRADVAARVPPHGSAAHPLLRRRAGRGVVGRGHRAHAQPGGAEDGGPDGAAPGRPVAALPDRPAARRPVAGRVRDRDPGEGRLGRVHRAHRDQGRQLDRAS